MELRQLTTFATVARMGSVTRAAERLNYAQSTVSSQIQVLEDDLGVRLFDRLGKQVVLTDAGRRLEQYARKLLDLAEEARTVVAEGDEPRGRLTISAYETLCTYRLPAVLRTYRERYPQVQLVFRPSPVSAVQRPVREGIVDVAFAMTPPLQADDLNIQRLVPEPLCILAHPEHSLAATGQVTSADLQAVPLLLTETGCGYRTPFERALARDGIYQLNPVMEFSSLEAIKQCVMAGMGLTILPKVAVMTELAQGRLVALEWKNHDLEIVTQMIWHKEKWLSPAMSAFLEVAEEVLVKASREELQFPEMVVG